MPDSFHDLLHSWQTFYFTLAAVAATLLGLMFVALSLGMNIVSAATKEEMKAFVTPSVIYFISLLLLSLVMLVPSYAMTGFGLLVAVGGGIGLIATLHYVRRLIRAALEHQDFTVADWLAQIIAPLISYALLVLAALGFLSGYAGEAFMVVCVAAIALLLSALHDTWSLVVWIVDRQ